MPAAEYWWQALASAQLEQMKAAAAASAEQLVKQVSENNQTQFTLAQREQQLESLAQRGYAHCLYSVLTAV